MMHIDVHHACFNARIDKDVFVELPPEDVNPCAPKQCGKLVKAMYGTRHAAVAWQSEVQRAMRELGVEAGTTS